MDYVGLPILHALLHKSYQYWADLVHLEVSEYPRIGYTVKGLLIVCVHLRKVCKFGLKSCCLLPNFQTFQKSKSNRIH